MNDNVAALPSPSSPSSLPSSPSTSPYTYTCRRATIADADTLAAFQIAMAKETEGIDLDPDTVFKGVRIPFAHPSLATYYVAEALPINDTSTFTAADSEEGVAESPSSSAVSSPPSTPVVVSGLMVTNEFNVFEDSTMWWIQSVYTTPSHRRRGLFASLYAFVKRLALEGEGEGGRGEGKVTVAVKEGEENRADADGLTSASETAAHTTRAGEGRVLGLRLYVEHENAAAQRSYAKLGMKVDPYIMAKEMKGSI